MYIVKIFEIRMNSKLWHELSQFKHTGPYGAHRDLEFDGGVYASLSCLVSFLQALPWATQSPERRSIHDKSDFLGSRWPIRII